MAKWTLTIMMATLQPGILVIVKIFKSPACAGENGRMILIGKWDKKRQAPRHNSMVSLFRIELYASHIRFRNI